MCVLQLVSEYSEDIRLIQSARGRMQPTRGRVVEEVLVILLSRDVARCFGDVGWAFQVGLVIGQGLFGFVRQCDAAGLRASGARETGWNDNLDHGVGGR